MLCFSPLPPCNTLTFCETVQGKLHFTKNSSVNPVLLVFLSLKILPSTHLNQTFTIILDSHVALPSFFNSQPNVSLEPNVSLKPYVSLTLTLAFNLTLALNLKLTLNLMFALNLTLALNLMLALNLSLWETPSQ